MDRRLRGSSMLRIALLGIVAFLATAYVAFRVALWLRPTLVDGHRTMATGHLAIAVVIGLVPAIAVMVADYRRQRRR